MENKLFKSDDEILESLKKCKLFKNIENTEEVLNFLQANKEVELKNLTSQNQIFRMGEEAQNAGIIISGKISVEKFLTNGERLSIAYKSSGDLIGEAAIFTLAKKYPCQLTALENSKVLLISRNAILDLLQKDKAILENFLTELSTMTFALQNKVELLSHSGITEKIAFFLLEKSRQTESSIIQLPESITNFASFLNVSRTSLHREMKKLENSGAIKISKKKIQILNKIKLEKSEQKKF